MSKRKEASIDPKPGLIASSLEIKITGLIEMGVHAGMFKIKALSKRTQPPK